MYVFDDSRLPLVIATVRGEITPAELERFKADLFATVERGQPFASIYDITDMEIPPREVIMETIRWSRAARELYKELYEQPGAQIPVFTAYHMPSKFGNLLRFALQMVPSVSAQHVICDSLAEAVAACEDAMGKAGVEIPPAAPDAAPV